MVALGLGSAVNLAFPEIIRRILNDGSLSGPSLNPMLLGTILILLFAFQGFCFYFRSFYFGLIGQQIVTELRRTLFTSIMSREVELFDQTRSGDLVSRLMNDTALMQDAVSIKLSVLIRYSLQVFVGLGLMIYMSPHLTVAIVIALIVLVFLSMILAKRLRSYSKLLQAEVGKATSIAEDSFTGIRVVKAYAKERFIERIFHRANMQVNSVGLQRIALSSFFQSFVNFLMNATLVCVLLYGILLASHQTMTFGDLTSFLLYGAIVAVSFAFAATSYGELAQAVGGAERVFEFIDSIPAQTSSGTPLPSNITGKLEFKNVSFRYPTRPEMLVLDSVSFTIPPGKTTAFVGSSGSGKSTLTNLLLKFYSPASGTICIDNIDIQTLDEISLREHITLIPQDARLFALSIKDNLLFGDEHATLESLQEICKKASIYDFVESLPSKFETVLGQSGASVSGGERQRLAIARALLRKPSILIMDESTSALDSENELRVQQALEGLMKGRTTIIIAHRLSSIKNADHIVVLDSGCVVQEGSYHELVSKPGAFQDFVRIQEKRSAA